MSYRSFSKNVSAKYKLSFKIYCSNCYDNEKKIRGTKSQLDVDRDCRGRTKLQLMDENKENIVSLENCSLTLLNNCYFKCEVSECKTDSWEELLTIVTMNGENSDRKFEKYDKNKVFRRLRFSSKTGSLFFEWKCSEILDFYLLPNFPLNNSQNRSIKIRNLMKKVRRSFVAMEQFFQKNDIITQFRQLRIDSSSFQPKSFSKELTTINDQHFQELFIKKMNVDKTQILKTLKFSQFINLHEMDIDISEIITPIIQLNNHTKTITLRTTDRQFNNTNLFLCGTDKVTNHLRTIIFNENYWKDEVVVKSQMKVVHSIHSHFFQFSTNLTTITFNIPEMRILPYSLIYALNLIEITVSKSSRCCIPLYLVDKFACNIRRVDQHWETAHELMMNLFMNSYILRISAVDDFANFCNYISSYLTIDKKQCYKNHFDENGRIVGCDSFHVYHKDYLNDYPGGRPQIFTLPSLFALSAAKFYDCVYYRNSQSINQRLSSEQPYQYYNRHGKKQLSQLGAFELDKKRMRMSKDATKFYYPEVIRMLPKKLVQRMFNEIHSICVVCRRVLHLQMIYSVQSNEIRSFAYCRMCTRHRKVDYFRVAVVQN
ncbi:hypothetical protein SNEBB_006875 [Seison nebaliae]|nr:hypothetical protein SNEBB_006875 [Seison nebaliae]